MKDRLSAIYLSHRDQFSGTCLVKSADDIILAEASGLANRDFGVPNQMHTLFDTASITKLFTAAAILLLVQRGLLRLDDPIAAVIDLSGTQIPTDVVIEQLLNHTSGIADDADEEAGEDYSALFVHKPNYSVRNCADFLPQFAQKRPVFAAGTDVRYNNCAFVLLGLAIERVTGMDYRSFVAEQIFAPCGMRHTHFYAKDEPCPNAAEGYFAAPDGNGTKWKKNIYSFPPIGTPDGGAFATASDLDTFIRAIRAGKLLDGAHTQLLMTPHCAFTRPFRIGQRRTGYGFEFIESDGRVFCLFKEGQNPGVDAICSYYPDLDLSLILLSNQDGPLWQMYREMQAVLYDEWRFR